MSDGSYQWPPDLFSLLVEAIPALTRSKEDVLTFFRGCGVAEGDLASYRARLAVDRDSVRKHEMTRGILTVLNERGDGGLAVRRAVLQRVVEIEDFSTCWDDQRHKAKSVVGDIRSLIHRKDSVTRIVQERDADREELRRRRREEQEAAARRRQVRLNLRRRIAELRHEPDHRKRGLELEKVLNAVFALDGVLVREAFTLRDEDGTPIEQVDGVVELDGTQYLVEMKWWTDKIDVNAVSRHLVRVYGRAGVGGIVISASGYTPGAINECRTALVQKVIVLLDLAEIQLVLEREADVAGWLREKLRSVVLEKQPYLPPRLA